jgi:menaquinone-dependent protoporphyrinogen oxidase
VKALIVFASHFGQTRAVAERIFERLKAAGHQVDLADAARPNTPVPENYDLVILGSRVEVGRHASDIHNYVMRHHAVLTDMPTAFFSVSMAAAKPDAGPDPNGYMSALFEDLDWRPTRMAVFAGGLPYRKYNVILRFIMKQISKSAGHTTDTSRNHEFTQWPRVDAFADELANLRLPRPSPASSDTSQETRR